MGAQASAPPAVVASCSTLISRRLNTRIFVERTLTMSTPVQIKTQSGMSTVLESALVITPPPEYPIDHITEEGGSLPLAFAMSPEYMAKREAELLEKYKIKVFFDKPKGKTLSLVEEILDKKKKGQSLAGILDKL